MFKRSAHTGTNSPYFQDLTRRDKYRINITEEDFNFTIKFRYKETFRIFAS
jgi:hypothetical protein